MDKNNLGKRIQRARQQRGFTQDEIEKQLHFPQKSLTRIESGQRLPTTIELSKLAELFHIPIGDFLVSNASDEDPIITLHRIAPGLEKDPTVREEINRCIHLCKEGISLERLLGQPTRQYVLFSLSKNPQLLQKRSDKASRPLLKKERD